MRLKSTLLSTARALQEAGISFLCYKGPALSTFAFGAPLLRQSGDIDLWVEKSDIDKVTRLLSSMGYEPARPRPPIEIHLEFTYEYALAHKETGIVIELHWSLMPHRYGGGLPFAPTLLRSRTVTIEQVPLPTLSTEDAIVALASHGSKHLWYRIIWLYDLVGLLHNHEPDWMVVQKLALDSGNHRRVGVALLLLERLFQLEPPREWRFSRRTRHLAQVAYRMLLAPPGKARAYLTLLALEDSPTGALRAACSLMFHPTVHDISFPKAPLPRYLYYLIRPWRWLLSSLGIHRPAGKPDRRA